MSALLLHNYGDYFVDGLRKELCARECRNMHTKCERNIKFLLCHFSLNKMGKCLQYLNSSVL